MVNYYIFIVNGVVVFVPLPNPAATATNGMSKVGKISNRMMAIV